MSKTVNQSAKRPVSYPVSQIARWCSQSVIQPGSILDSYQVTQPASCSVSQSFFKQTSQIPRQSVSQSAKGAAEDPESRLREEEDDDQGAAGGGEDGRVSRTGVAQKIKYSPLN